jgi:hypothetical protein
MSRVGPGGAPDASPSLTRYPPGMSRVDGALPERRLATAIWTALHHSDLDAIAIARGKSQEPNSRGVVNGRALERMSGLAPIHKKGRACEGRLQYRSSERRLRAALAW